MPNKNIIAEYKFLSKSLLEEANNAAHREKRSKCINPNQFSKFSDDFIFYIIKKFYHRKNEVRLMVIIDEDQNFELLDVSITRYLSFPSIKYFDDDTFEVQLSERPYPNGREWQETEIKKPVRQQDKFRSEVLSKYNYTCAVCDNNHKSLLRAAHILPVANGGPDSINNGISLCVNHEIAFDRGIMKILPDYQISCSKNIGINVEILRLPSNKDDYPSPRYLEEKIELLSNTKGEEEIKHISDI